MPSFRNGTRVSYPHGKKRKDGTAREQKYLQISAGPQRLKYVHDLIMEAKLGRPLEGDETVEHKNGNGLDLIGDGTVAGDNLVVVTRSFNSRLRTIREKKARAAEAGQELIEWKNQF